MKRSFVVITGLAGVVVAAGWMQHRRVESLEEEYRQEQAKAAGLGLSEDGARDDSKATMLSNRPESGAKAEALLKHFGTLKATDEFPVDQIPLDLGASDLELLCDRLLSGRGMDAEVRLKLVRNLARLYATRYPEMMLRLYTASPEFSSGQAGAPYLVGAALKQWSGVNPLAAAAWAREMAEKMPELVNATARMEILGGAARANPAAAISLASELGLQDEPKAWSEIGESVKTPGEWSSLLAAVRNYDRSTGAGDARMSAVLGGLGRSVFAGGFQDASQWLDGAALTEAEKAAIVGELHPWFSKKEAGQWLDWLGKNIDGEALADKTEELMAEWTRKDYATAGAWLKDKPDGPLRDASITGFANALAPYEPAAASDWAMQLPPGDARTGLLKKICDEWEKKDPAAAAGFARQAGLSAR